MNDNSSATASVFLTTHYCYNRPNSIIQVNTLANGFLIIITEIVLYWSRLPQDKVVRVFDFVQRCS